MGIYALLGALKARETSLAHVQEIAGSSAGAIIALFIAIGMSIHEISRACLSLNVPDFVKIRIGSFFNTFGFVDIHPVRTKLVEMCRGSDPTFSQLPMKIYIAAFCLNTSETVYFSRDTHPNMKVIDAVCMSIAIPILFASGSYDGKTYIDGGTHESYPLAPFYDKKPHEVTCFKIRMNRVFQETIRTPKQFIESLIRSSICARTNEPPPFINMVDINVENTDVFDFNISYEDKVRLYNLGYTFLSG